LSYLHAATNRPVQLDPGVSQVLAFPSEQRRELGGREPGAPVVIGEHLGEGVEEADVVVGIETERSPGVHALTAGGDQICTYVDLVGFCE
jgi:hypothetical protein